MNAPTSGALDADTAAPLVRSAPAAGELQSPPPRPTGERAQRYRLLAWDAGALLALSLIGAMGHAPVRMLVTMPFGILVAFRILALYSPQSAPSALDQSSKIGLAASAASLGAGAVAHVPAGQAGVLAVCAALSLILVRSAAYAVERRRAVACPRRALIVGTSAIAQELAHRLVQHPEHGMLPIGFVDEDPAPIDPDTGLAVLGRPAALPALVREFSIDRLIVDSSSICEDDLIDLLDRTTRSGVEVTVLPALARHLSTAITTEGVAGFTLLTHRRSRPSGMSWMAKRCVDVALAAVLLLLTAPILFLVAVAVRVDSPGPVLFRQVRVGRHGRVFSLLKFRSMTTDAEDRLIDLTPLNEADGPYFKLRRDPRVTRVGRIIRRWSLDELPQLINVLRGEMSLVGPRPALPQEVAGFPNWLRHRLDVLPGLTGLWQVSGRFLLAFHEAGRLDAFYVDHWSFGLDLKILLRTPAVVLSGRGAR